MELVPDIAYGNLAASSLAEVLAAAFRANATGTIAVEQGRGESRVFVHYGSPCGTQVLQPTHTFGQYLVVAEALTRDVVAPIERQADQRKVALSTLLIDQQVLPADQVLSLLAAYHHEQLVALCLVREGKYELRGWERPPEWTESIHLDPLRALTTALASEQLADRRQAILALIGGRKLGVSIDFEDLAGRLYVDDADVRAIQLLRDPMTVDAYVQALGGVAAEAAVVTYALLGLVDEAADQPAFEGQAAVPIHIEESAFPVMVEEPESPPTVTFGPSSRSGGPISRSRIALNEQDDIDVQFDVEPATAAPPTKAPATSPAFAPLFDEQPSDDQAVGQWSEEMAIRLDEALTGPVHTEPEGYTTLPQGTLSAVSVGAPTQPSAEEDVPTLHASESRGFYGQVEFEAPDSMDSLELDLARAPKEILRDTMDRENRRRPAPPRKSARTTDPMLPRVTVGDAGSTDPSLRVTGPISTAVGRGARTQAPATRPAARANRADEYNPFRAHFRKRTAPATAAAVGTDPLDEALDRALGTGRHAPPPPPPPPAPPRREPTASTGPVRSVPPPRRPAPEKPTVPPSGAPTVAGRAPRAPLVQESDILAAIEASENQAPAPAARAEPIDIPLEETRVGAGDNLALDIAREEALEEDVAAFVGEDAPPTEPPPEPEISAEISAEVELEESVEDSVEERKPPPEPLSPEEEERRNKAATELRRRMLQRALRSVGSGPFQPRSNPPEGAVVETVSNPPAAAEGAAADKELERDLEQRAKKAASGDHFATLDLQHTAGTDQVKEAFLTLAKRYHPDRLSSQGQVQLLPLARDVFAKVKDAYDALLDPATRARHLNELEAKSGATRKMTRDDAKGAYQRALVYLKRKDFRQAEAELVRAIDTDPAPDYLAELAWTILSNPLRREEGHDEVKSLVARALKSGDPSDRVFVVAAHVARGEGDLVRMEKFFNSALEKNPKNVEAARELRLIEMRREAPKPSGLLDRFRKK